MKRKLLFTLGCLVGLATLSYGIYAWYNAITYVSTDDAYVEGTISPVSAKVAGHVVELLVQDNQVVKKGDLLMRIDPRDFQAKREQARAAVATAEATLRAARSEVPLTREGTRAQLYRNWEIFADSFPPAPYLSGSRIGALDFLAVVVSRWGGARPEIKQRRPEFFATLTRIEQHPVVAAAFAKHWGG